MTGTILPKNKGYLIMLRNVNMLKNLKKVRFCRFYGFLCKNAVLCLSSEKAFVPREIFVIH